MDITCYLPDDIGERAKEAELPFSRLLRAAVEEELRRLAVVAETLDRASEWEIELRNENGDPYTGRLTGALLADDGHFVVYLTDDERIIVHDYRNERFHQIEDADALRDLGLREKEYVQVCNQLGLRPVVDL